MLSSDRKPGHGAVGSFLNEGNEQGKITAERTSVIGERDSRATNDLDQAALLRRIAKYIEEDATAADKLAAVVRNLESSDAKLAEHDKSQRRQS